MSAKLSAKQQVQLAWLQTIPPKLDRIHRVIEQMAAMQADPVQVRGIQRVLDELKAQASTQGVTGLSDTFGYMGMLLRRGGGHQLKVRGLRELLVGARTNFEGALRQASTPEETAATDEPEPTSP